MLLKFEVEVELEDTLDSKQLYALTESLKSEIASHLEYDGMWPVVVEYVGLGSTYRGTHSSTERSHNEQR